jgi:hypothetical protein
MYLPSLLVCATCHRRVTKAEQLWRWLRLSRSQRPGRRAAGGAGRARREPALHTGAVEPVPARREHADALAVRQLRQADGALGLRPRAGRAGVSGSRGAHAVGCARCVGRQLGRPRGAAAREAADEESGGGVEGEGEDGDAGEDDEDGGHVGEEGTGAGPRGGGGRRRGGDHGRGSGVHRGRGGVVGPARHGSLLPSLRRFDVLLEELAVCVCVTGAIASIGRCCCL